MLEESRKFQSLFKKYKLKAEFATLSELGIALSDKGFIYEDSIFSHWQKGTRIPQNRIILLKLLEIFIERRAITTLDEANEFLFSTNQGNLSKEELDKFSIKFNNPIFQVPNEIINFTGRKEVIQKLTHENVLGKIILIHGPGGVGKTALAIKLGHLLRDKYKDGVLWYKVEEDNLMDILLSSARIFGEDISNIKDLQVRATVVRSLLASKNVLLFLDSAELSKDVYLLIPNSQFCTTIITSQKNSLKIPISYVDIIVKPFTDKEVLSLFKEVLENKYPRNNIDIILNVTKRVGNLPLAVHLLARQILQSEISIEQLPSLLNEKDSIFQDVYADKNLYTTIAMSYKKLDDKIKSLLVSASIFKGKDFSTNAIAYINGLSSPETAKILQHLVDLSLLEHSTKHRYRIHPAIQEFVRDKLDNPRSSRLIIIAICMFSFFTIWWIFLQLFVDKKNIFYPIFTSIYWIVALYGGIYGLQTSRNWGGLKTLMGKAIFMFSLGLFAQVFGQIVYSYYSNIQHVVPYPSIGDIGYFTTIPLYIYGAYLLAKSSGIKVNLQSFKEKILAFIIPVVMLIIGYILFLQDYKFNWDEPIKIFLDFIYPLGDAFYVSIAIIIFIFSRDILDGIMRSKALLLLVALAIQFFADYSFLYQSHFGNYYQGDFVDYIYLVAYFFMTLSLLHLKSLQVKIKNV